MASTAAHLVLTAVIRASGVKWDPTLRSKLPNLYVQVQLGNESRQTKAIKKNLFPVWNESFSFKRPITDQGAKFIIQIKHDSLRWTDKDVSIVEVDPDDLLAKRASGKGV
ncbi:uncharacterized protein FOMMEDRAFT_27063 [Fomitiporia mediterranea MF3/22]|uniref:uncharacterized protein n=1 Tax=Fomitiporia mediterranea (strain MF3/22) TaxID=694068 RepID=UPI0004408404|nr:uncharacterized protein FOMMEDRAFT_27063 [Fomitiporia mediterranea MF3/22]EJD04729.1 hypothetical protein FOMMEDRAFT_27063 [Fomitiporia mediterranea MF3/22]